MGETNIRFKEPNSAMKISWLFDEVGIRDWSKKQPANNGVEKQPVA